VSYGVYGDSQVNGYANDSELFLQLNKSINVCTWNPMDDRLFDRVNFIIIEQLCGLHLLIFICYIFCYAGFRWDRQWLVVNSKCRAYTQRQEPKLALVEVSLPMEAFSEKWEPTADSFLSNNLITIFVVIMPIVFFRTFDCLLNTYYDARLDSYLRCKVHSKKLHMHPIIWVHVVGLWRLLNCCFKYRMLIVIMSHMNNLCLSVIWKKKSDQLLVTFK